MSANAVSKHPLYQCYHDMRDRCANPKNRSWKYYGGKGVTVCLEWLGSYRVFYDWAIGAGYKPGLSIDRINGDGRYSPENCRWITRGENFSRAIRGEKHHSARLDESAVMRIRKLLDNGVPQATIARLHEVSRSTINHIAMGRTWRHV